MLALSRSSRSSFNSCTIASARRSSQSQVSMSYVYIGRLFSVYILLYGYLYVQLVLLVGQVTEIAEERNGGKFPASDKIIRNACHRAKYPFTAAFVCARSFHFRAKQKLVLLPSPNLLLILHHLMTLSLYHSRNVQHYSALNCINSEFQVHKQNSFYKLLIR